MTLPFDHRSLAELEPGARACSTCPATLGAKNVTGFCRACRARQQNADPAMQAARAAGIRAHFAKPGVKEAARARMARVVANEGEADRERRREHGKRIFREVLSRPDVQAKSRSPEVRRRAGITRTETVLGWCPADYRDAYRDLTIRGRVPAAEAKRVILDQVAADQRRSAGTPRAPTLEEQLARVRAGARVVTKPNLQPSYADRTLGGVATGLL